MAFTLINARPSPFGRKVAIALIEKSLEYSVIYDMPWGEDTRTPEFSPLEQLPILIAADGQRIYDSTYILEWLERRYPHPALLPEDTDEALHQKLVQMLAERLMEISQSLIFEMQRPAPSEAWIDRQSRKISSGLAELDRQIGDQPPGHDQPLLLGDIATGATLLALEFGIRHDFCPDLALLRWRQRYPNLCHYIGQIEERPSFVSTRPELMDVDLGATVG